ncbi:hypothetical protein PQE71_gp091 [Bacillus phage Izhevsk]|uniref:Uncharacterized protein n=1 Tax=Bacillus phage Izhevsk TaxID=2724322 RepID=A0A6H0X651_9CAUD|nr:hypothetical protein PQE71_gp091 [Bacillus phage Izhevsk]QIW89773.1 hypothetical protein Izhevsk_92 [Bacillus phage Izhevsk]
MKTNKNILKGNRFHEPKAVNKFNFYAVVELTSKDKAGNTIKKDVLVTTENPTTRIQAEKELTLQAKKMGGKVTYFGGFKK